MNGESVSKNVDGLSGWVCGGGGGNLAGDCSVATGEGDDAGCGFGGVGEELVDFFWV